MDRPWMKFHTRDWLDNKELRRCSRPAIATLADLMCLAHEGSPYGYLTDKTGPLTEEYMASRCIVPVGQFRRDMKELLSSDRLKEKDGLIYVGRMVKDEETRLKRAAGGSTSKGNPKLRAEGYPSSSLNGLPTLEINSRARMRPDSGSGSGVEFESENKGCELSPLIERYHEFVELWPAHNRRGVDFGAQVWITFVDSGKITAVTIDEVFQGLERHKKSESWNRDGGKFIPAIADEVKPGWLQKRAWKDFPKQMEIDSWAS